MKHGGIPVPEKARIFVQHWTSEEEAFEMEKWWIALFGRKDDRTGCLENRDDGGVAPSHKTSAKGGRIAGHKNVESGWIQRLGRKQGRIIGPIQGRRNAENGHLQRISVKGGQAAVASGQVLRAAALADRAKGGRSGGRKNVESGHIQELGRKYGGKFWTPETHAKAGRIGGKINAESGQIQAVQLTSNHIRWHVKRNVVNPTCSFCITSDGAEIRSNPLSGQA